MCLSKCLAVDTHDEAAVYFPVHVQYYTSRVGVLGNDFGKCKVRSELALQKNGECSPQLLVREIWLSSSK